MDPGGAFVRLGTAVAYAVDKPESGAVIDRVILAGCRLVSFDLINQPGAAVANVTFNFIDDVRDRISFK